jgi:hypothetical protein
MCDNANGPSPIQSNSSVMRRAHRCGFDAHRLWAGVSPIESVRTLPYGAVGTRRVSWTQQSNVSCWVGNCAI